MGIVAFMVAMTLLGGWAATRPALVKVDGRYQVIRSGETVGQLVRSGKVSARRGSLLSVDGKVLKPQGGYLPVVTRNGREVGLSQRVLPGDEIVSSAGRDRRERIRIIERAIPFKTRYTGRGPLTELAALGSPGVMKVTMGAISGREVTHTVSLAPTDMVVHRTHPSGKVVALTFDDGPWPHQTNKVLDVLKSENVHATFFVLGRQAKRFPGVVRRELEEGNSLGSHSYSHKPFDTLSAGRVRKEIREGRKAISKATGHDTLWLRPPYGAMDDQAWQQVRDMDARVVLWNVDSRDWTKPGVKHIEKTVLRTVHPGSVVLFHDGGGDRSQTIKALPHIISALRKRGYEFVTIDQLDAMHQAEHRVIRKDGKS